MPKCRSWKNSRTFHKNIHWVVRTTDGKNEWEKLVNIIKNNRNIERVRNYYQNRKRNTIKRKKIWMKIASGARLVRPRTALKKHSLKVFS